MNLTRQTISSQKYFQNNKFGEPLDFIGFHQYESFPHSNEVIESENYLQNTQARDMPQIDRGVSVFLLFHKTI